MHFHIALYKHTSYIVLLCCVLLLNRQQVTEDSGTAPKSTLSKGQRANHSLSRNMSDITNESSDPPLQLALLRGCSWGHSASMLKIRKAAWVASYKWSKRIILFSRGISFSSISTNNDQHPQKRTFRTDEVIPFSLKCP